MIEEIPFADLSAAVREIDPIRLSGRIEEIVGMVVESTGPATSLGELCLIQSENEHRSIPAEVVGFRGDRVLTMPLAELSGVRLGDKVVARGRYATLPVGDELLGRVLDGLGRPIDSKGPITCRYRYPVSREPTNPLERENIDEPLSTGIRAMDALATCGKGQRMGIFSGSGVGKSTILGMIARNTSADVNVIALVGERGREVRRFLEKDLGEEGLARSVVVVSTSDEAPLLRVRAGLSAMAIAEYFRDSGSDVLLMMDSITRLAMAQREIGLAVGEPLSTKSYTPSVFALLPKLLERAGNFRSGSITGFITILVEGDDMTDPVADSCRAILDGHVLLSRELATRGHFPAIDILDSVSRLMVDVVSDDHLQAARKVRKLLANYRQSEDLINIGAYASGSNADIDDAIARIQPLNEFLTQEIEEKSDLTACYAAMNEVLA